MEVEYALKVLVLVLLLFGALLLVNVERLELFWGSLGLLDWSRNI